MVKQLVGFLFLFCVNTVTLTKILDKYKSGIPTSNQARKVSRSRLVSPTMAMAKIKQPSKQIVKHPVSPTMAMAAPWTTWLGRPAARLTTV